MKKTILFSLLIFCYFFSYSQDTIIETIGNRSVENNTVVKKDNQYIGYRLIVEEAIGVSFWSEHGFSMAIINGIQLNRYIYSGYKFAYYQIGADKYSKSIFGGVNLRVNYADNDVTPFSSITIGLAHIFEDPDIESPLRTILAYDIHMGIQMKVNNKILINLSIGLDIIPTYDYMYTFQYPTNIVRSNVFANAKLGVSIY